MSPENVAPHTEQHPNPKISEEEFGRQFEEQKSITIDGKTIFYHAVEPADPVSERWVLYIGGFRTTADNYKNQIKDLAVAGSRVLFTNPMEGIEAPEDEALTQAGVPQVIQNKAREVAALIGALKLGVVDVVGHSQGGVVAASLELMHPESTRALVLDSPAGTFAGNDSFKSQWKRERVDRTAAVASFLTDDQLKANASKVAPTENVLADNTPGETAWRADYELPALAQAKLASILAAIKKRQREGADQSITLLYNKNDQLFPASDIETVLTAPNGSLIDLVDAALMRSNKNATHNAAHDAVGPSDTNLIQQLLAQADQHKK